MDFEASFNLLCWKNDGASLIMSHHGKNRCGDTEGEKGRSQRLSPGFCSSGVKGLGVSHPPPSSWPQLLQQPSPISASSSLWNGCFNQFTFFHLYYPPEPRIRRLINARGCGCVSRVVCRVPQVQVTWSSAAQSQVLGEKKLALGLFG